MLTFKAEFDVKVWAKWAEANNIPGIFINFALLTPEIFERDASINARSYTMFANACASLSNFDSEETLEKIHLLSDACFGDEFINNLFIQFIHNKLDKLVSPEDILKGDWDVIKHRLEENVYNSSDEYKSTIASTLTIRFINYLEKYFSSDLDKNKSDKVIDRIIDLCVNVDKPLLSEDLIFKMIKTINAKFSARCSKLLRYPEIREKLF